MLNLVAVIASTFFGNYFANKTPPPSVVLLEFAVSKSRVIVFAMIAVITLAILFSGGMLITILGAAAWISADLNEVTTHAQILVYSGAGLMVLTTTGAITLFSKDRFNFSIDPSKFPLATLESQPAESSPIQKIASALANEMEKNKAEKKQKTEVNKKTVHTHPATPTHHPSKIKHIESHH